MSLIGLGTSRTNDITGGSKTISGDYTIHTFTTNGTFSLDYPIKADYLIVAGGGGGSSSTYGGGGAGGYLYFTSTLVSGTSMSVVVGQTISSHSTGNNSSFNDSISYGGGAGANYTERGGTGGSGGGGAISYNGGGYGTAGQGTSGGAATYSTGGGGGGGAGAAGQSTSYGGSGGIGKYNSISGSGVYYAGGGGGYNGSTRPSGSGSIGQGGASQGGTGAAGIVIIRYLTSSLDQDTIESSLRIGDNPITLDVIPYADVSSTRQETATYTNLFNFYVSVYNSGFTNNFWFTISCPTDVNYAGTSAIFSVDQYQTEEITFRDKFSSIGTKTVYIDLYTSDPYSTGEVLLSRTTASIIVGATAAYIIPHWTFIPSTTLDDGTFFFECWMENYGGSNAYNVQIWLEWVSGSYTHLTINNPTTTFGHMDGYTNTQYSRQSICKTNIQVSGTSDVKFYYNARWTDSTGTIYYYYGGSMSSQSITIRFTHV